MKQHTGRSWEGHAIEDACPCLKEACGLVSVPDLGCEQHGPAFARTMRQGHPANACPALPEDPREKGEHPLKVTAALAWYDEPVDLLTACVTAAAEIADRIVAVDGAYRRYPDAKIASPKEQATAIRRAAAKVGLECDIVIPDRLWAGQVEKRSFLVERAARGSDWLAMIDADHIIHADREAARAQLEGYGSDVDIVNVDFYTPLHPTRSLDESSASHWHADLADKRIKHCHFLRALPGLRVERFHYWYSGLKDGERVWLPFGASPSHTAAPYPIINPHNLKHARYEVEHLTLLRDEKHILDGRAFCNDRVMVVRETGQEDDVPGLPDPVFDRETVPY